MSLHARSIAVLMAFTASTLLVLPAAAAPVFHASRLHEASGYPFSEAVEVDGWLLLSGVIGTARGTNELIEGGMEAQSRAALDILQATVEKHGYSMSEVVKCTVMIEDMADWPLFNRIYMEYFSPPYPARSAFGTDGLALGAAVELECMAHH